MVACQLLEREQDKTGALTLNHQVFRLRSVEF